MQKSEMKWQWVSTMLIETWPLVHDQNQYSSITSKKTMGFISAYAHIIPSRTLQFVLMDFVLVAWIKLSKTQWTCRLNQLLITSHQNSQLSTEKEKKKNKEIFFIIIDLYDTHVCIYIKSNDTILKVSFLSMDIHFLLYTIFWEGHTC